MPINARTVPLAMPRHTAAPPSVSAHQGNGGVNACTTVQPPAVVKHATRVRALALRSASQPPTGRARPASATQPAVAATVSPCPNWYSARR